MSLMLRSAMEDGSPLELDAAPVVPIERDAHPRCMPPGASKAQLSIQEKTSSRRDARDTDTLTFLFPRPE